MLRAPERRELFFWWVLAWLALAVCGVMRGYMDDIGLPVHGAGTEEALFGSLPTVWLQAHVYPISPTFFSWAVRAIHGSWFVVPWLVGLLVSWKRPQRIGSFFLCWIGLHFIVNPIFALFPMQPPWMANAEVIRVAALHTARDIPDDNPLAAMPSLHVALPLLISLWLFRERWTMPALAMLGYATLIAFEVVFSGEHYVVDVAGGVVVAGAIALAMRIDYRGISSRLSPRLETLNLPPAVRRAAPLRFDRDVASGGIKPGLTSRPATIFALTAALIVLVSVQATLSLWS